MEAPKTFIYEGDIFNKIELVEMMEFFDRGYNCYTQMIYFEDSKRNIIEFHLIDN